MSNNINLSIDCSEINIDARGSTVVANLVNADFNDIMDGILQSKSDGEILQELDVGAAIEEYGVTKILDYIDPEEIMNYIGFDAFAEHFETEFKLHRLGL